MWRYYLMAKESAVMWKRIEAAKEVGAGKEAEADLHQ